MPDRGDSDPSAPALCARRDARRNRARVLTAARDHVASGGQVRVDSVARQARVGIGTVYRHFPSKADLLSAAVDVYGLELAASLGKLVRDVADARQALELIATGPGCDLVLRAVCGRCPGMSGGVAAELHAVVADVVDHGTRTAQLRPDVEVDDVAALLLATRAPSPAVAARRRRAVLDGLMRASAVTRSDGA